MKLRSLISTAFWCNARGEYKEAKINSGGDSEGTDAYRNWLDVMFHGGLTLPPKNRPLTLLITGQPGTGKSSLALEMAYNWTTNKRKNILISDDDSTINDPDEYLRALYISTEADLNWAKAKEKTLRWVVDNKRSQIFEYDKTSENDDLRNLMVLSAGRGLLVKKVFVAKTVKFILSINRFLTPVRSFFNYLIDESNARIQVKGLQKFLVRGNPSILVFDSLNVISESKNRARFFDKVVDRLCDEKNYRKGNSKVPMVVIMILNSSSDSSDATSYWRYVADVVINMSCKSDSDYYTREIEIEKARYQSHVWGKHQLKFVEPYNREKKSTDNGEEDLYIISRKRYHPYKDEGGIFIYPAIHYYLSEYKRKSPTEITGRYSSSLVEELDPFLKSLSDAEQEKLKSAKDIQNSSEPLFGSDLAGFPRGRCTGFIGIRGGHKSHLAYRVLLHHVMGISGGGQAVKYKALVISLRDDEAMANHSISKIWSELCVRNNISGNNDTWKKNLEVLYFPPGNITPSEFFHRVYLSIQRLKHEKDENGNPVQVLVMFNSLDQLSSRFPLCAEEKIFIPGLISMLNDEQISSIFIGVEEAGQPKEQYGLLSMADALIYFKRIQMEIEEYKKHIPEDLSKVFSGIEDSEFHHPVVMEIRRFSGGQPAGDTGILELVDQEKGEFKDKHGLHFFRCSQMRDLYQTSGLSRLG